MRMNRIQQAAVLFLTCGACSFSSVYAAETKVATQQSASEEKEGQWNTSRIMGQMRWELGNTDWTVGTAFPLDRVLAYSDEELEEFIRQEVRRGNGADRHRTQLHRTVEALILDGKDASRKRALEILQKLIAYHHVEDINKVITTHGIEYYGITQRQESGAKIYEITPPNEQRPTVLNVRELAYEYAALYLLTGEKKYAEKSRDIMLRFSEVVASWPLYDRDNKPQSQDDERYLARSEANGIWAVWGPLDFLESLSMLRAYDIIRPTLTSTEIEQIREKFFVHQKELNDRFSTQLNRYTNLLGYRLQPLIIFGRVLEKPDYVHEAIEYMKDLMRYSYTVDGFWREVTPGYHRQITSRLMGSCVLAAKGYSDPEGYVYAPTGKRFDNLDLDKFFDIQFAQMREGLNVLAMPDGTYVSLNDSWPKSDKVDPDMDPAVLHQPGLLGIAGVSKLGVKDMVAFMNFGGRRGHDQDSSLGLVWFAGGREVFSETGYQALPDSGSSRKWNTMSASHHTVTVNESTYIFAPERLPDSLRVPEAGTPEAENALLTKVQPTAAERANQGRLLLWQTDNEKVQAMEAEREDTYPGVTSLFRRSVLMLPGENGDGILVDIFRIKGGKTHDFALRGGLDGRYKMEFDVELKPAEGTFYDYIQLKEIADIQAPMLATTKYADGYKVQSHLLKVEGSEDAKLQLLVGEAPAIRRLGTAPFSYVRHQQPHDKNTLETCYVWVHEAGRESKIRSVKAEAKGMDVVVIIEKEQGKEIIFSGENEGSHFQFEGWTFTGRMAYASETASEKTGAVFSGNKLERNSELVAKANLSSFGTVVSTTRREAGADQDSLLVELKESVVQEGVKPNLVHVDFGDFIRFSIPVEKILQEEEKVRLYLAHSPGLDIEAKKAIMSNSPGWAFSGVPSVRIDYKVTYP